jgi:hypothetical protein
MSRIKGTGKNEKHISARIPTALYEQLKRISEERNLKLNQVYKQAMVDFVMKQFLE